MNTPESIKFGIEVESLLLDTVGKPCPLTVEEQRTPILMDPEAAWLLSTITTEVEVKNALPHANAQAAVAEIQQKIEQVKQAALLKGRSLTFDSRVQELMPLNTIGTHIHLDLQPFEVYRNQDPQFMNLIGSEFMRDWLEIIVSRYCYSKRIKTRVQRVIKEVDCNFDCHADDILEQKLIRFSAKNQSVKLLKDRRSKGSLELCMPDSFDATAEPDILEDLVKDARKALYECIKSYERNEITPMGNHELEDVLSRLL